MSREDMSRRSGHGSQLFSADMWVRGGSVRGKLKLKEGGWRGGLGR